MFKEADILTIIISLLNIRKKYYGLSYAVYGIFLTVLLVCC